MVLGRGSSQKFFFSARRWLFVYAAAVFLFCPPMIHLTEKVSLEEILPPEPKPETPNEILAKAIAIVLALAVFMFCMAYLLKR